MYAPPAHDYSGGAVTLPTVDPADDVPPVCGCDFTDATFDYTAQTCGSGYTHVSSSNVVKMTLTSSVRRSVTATTRCA